MAFEWFWNFVNYENIEVVSVALGVLVFVVCFDLLKKRFDKTPAFIVALVIGVFLAWRIYAAPELVENGVFGLLLIALAVGVFFVIVRAFFRFGKHQSRS